MTGVSSDVAAAWLLAALLVTVLAILDVVIQAFSLHSALARGKVHAPELAGVALIARCIATISIWLAAGFSLGILRTPQGCSPADASMLWLGLLYPLTLWPALFLARKAGVRLSLGYFAVQAIAPASLILMGGITCL